MFTRSMARTQEEKIKYVFDQPTVMHCIITSLMKDNYFKTKDLCNLYCVFKSNVRSSDMINHELKNLHYNHYHSVTTSKDIARCVRWITLNYINVCTNINIFKSKAKIDCFINCLKHIHESHTFTMYSNTRLKNAIQDRIAHHKNYINAHVIKGISSPSTYINKLNFYKDAFFMY